MPPIATEHPSTSRAPRGSVEPRLSLRGVSKTFGGVKVLHDVDVDIAAGEVHGLVGQNGSGKSTLIKVLSGFHQPDPGSRIAIDGSPLGLPVRPAALRRHGVSFVHQDLGLVATASVVENVKVGQFTVGPLSRRIRWQHDAREVASVLDTLGAASVDPFASVASLDHGQRASVAIARAVLSTSPGTGCVVFDESTQSLPREIIAEFYAQVRRLAATGTSVLLVSHRLEEVLALCDSVTVLQDGRVSLAGAWTRDLTEQELTRLILGGTRRPLDAASSGMMKPAAVPAGKVALVATAVHGDRVHGASLQVAAGEVVGVTGDSESGYEELPYLIGGARRARSGRLDVGSTTLDLRRASPRLAAQAGIALVPGHRADEGLALERPASDNVSLPRVGTPSQRLYLRKRWQLDDFTTFGHRLGVTPLAPTMVAGSYSGGNQQKLVIAKWLLTRPSVLVMHEPAQAVDVGARSDILQAVREQAAAGTAVLVCSLEHDDLAAVCDRVLVLRDGVVAHELTGEAVTANAIIEAVYGPGDADPTRTTR